jgi:dephospho-CoA kinase
LSRVIGLTGGIASGKSTVAAMLAGKGAFVVDADQLARKAVEPGSPALEEVASAFGREMIGPDGSLDRARLGELAFSDQQARERLNAIVHPRVMELSQEEIRRASEAGSSLVVYDVPLLFETGREKEFDGTLVVFARPETQLLRLRERSGLEEAAARSRIEAQIPIWRKLAMATWIIDNGGSRDQTQMAVDRLWEAELSPPR